MAINHLSLGSNLGSREKHLSDAILALQDEDIKIKRISKIYETEPIGMEKNENWFLNCCVEVETSYTPERLLDICRKIEQKLGRKPNTHHKPREIDLDILFFENQIINTADLTIPHKELHKRCFVLTPLAEIAASFVHPVLKKTIAELLNECRDKSIVRVRAGF